MAFLHYKGLSIQGRPALLIILVINVKMSLNIRKSYRNEVTAYRYFNTDYILVLYLSLSIQSSFFFPHYTILQDLNKHILLNIRSRSFLNEYFTKGSFKGLKVAMNTFYIRCLFLQKSAYWNPVIMNSNCDADCTYLTDP